MLYAIKIEKMAFLREGEIFSRKNLIGTKVESFMLISKFKHVSVTKYSKK
jgi:hypothetical protein